MACRARRGSSSVRQGLRLRGVRQISLREFDASAVLPGLAARVLGALPIVAVVDDHVGARARERDRDGLADAAIRARDESSPSLKLHALILHS